MFRESSEVRRSTPKAGWLLPLTAALLFTGGACSSDGAADAGPPKSTVALSETTPTEPPVEDLEFTATSTTSFGGSAPCGDGGQALEATGSGESPQLGSYSLVASHCTLLPSGEIVDGKATYDFGDGDEMYGTYVGQCDLADLSAATCTLDITIEGGTGRFSRATGGVVAEGVVDVVAGTGEETLSGTISEVAPQRSSS